MRANHKRHWLGGHALCGWVHWKGWCLGFKERLKEVNKWLGWLGEWVGCLGGACSPAQHAT